MPIGRGYVDNAADTLRNDALSPLKRLRAYIDATITAVRNHGLKNGCLVGNFAAEASDHSEIIRKRVSLRLLMWQVLSSRDCKVRG